MKQHHRTIRTLITLSILCMQITLMAQHWDWAQHIHSYAPYYPQNVTHDSSGNAYTILHDGAGGIAARKVSPDGTLLWETVSTGSSPTHNDMNIAVDAAENVYIVGGYHGSINFGGLTLNGDINDASMFLYKFNSQGTPVWAKRIHPVPQSSKRDIAIDSNGNIIVTGTISGTVFFDTTVSASANSNHNAFIVKLTSSGDVVWIRRAQGNVSNTIALDVDGQGNIYGIGTYTGLVHWNSTLLPLASSTMSYRIKLNSAGTVMWADKVNATLSSIAVDNAGSSYLAGSFSGTISMGSGASLSSAGGTDIVAAKYNTNGMLVWARSAGGTANDQANSIGVDQMGNNFVGGSCQGNAIFDSQSLTLPTQAYSVGFVAKYASNGAIKWVDPVKTDKLARVEKLTTHPNGINYVISSHDAPVTFGEDTTLTFPWHHTLARLDGNAKRIKVIKIYEAFVCWPCFDLVIDFEYRFWAARQSVEDAVRRKVSDPGNRDRVYWKGDHLEIALHDRLRDERHYFQLRGINEDGSLTSWTNALEFVPGQTSRLLIGPNPVSSELRIEYSTLEKEEITMILYDRSGKTLLHQKEIASKGNNTFIIDMRALSSEANPITLIIHSKLQGSFSKELIKR